MGRNVFRRIWSPDRASSRAWKLGILRTSNDLDCYRGGGRAPCCRVNLISLPIASRKNTRSIGRTTPARGICGISWTLADFVRHPPYVSSGRRGTLNTWARKISRAPRVDHINIPA